MKSGTKVLIVALVVMMLALAIAYASFSGVLKVSGKADASGKFEVVFTNGIVSTADHGTAKEYQIALANKLKILIQNLDTTGNEVLQSGESTTITFTVKWKKDSTAKSATAEFDIELDYEQATEEFTGTASDVNAKN